MVNNFQGDAAMSLASFRKDITIEVFNTAGQLSFSPTTSSAAGSRSTRRCRSLDAGGNAVMISTIKLENEGWVRDTAVAEPQET